MKPLSLTIGSLFAGIGGFDLAAEWMGWRTIWFSEIDPYASAVLRERFPGIPNLGDITRIAWDGVAVPDVLCGGFPCQDISNAGKRAGITGTRSGLWTEFARAIRDIRPRYVVVENVRALLVRGLDVVLRDLANLGYDAEWDVLSAADVGAPHLRERLWIVAYPQEIRDCGQSHNGDRGADNKTTRKLGGRSICRNMGNANVTGLEGCGRLLECKREWTTWADGEIFTGADGKRRLRKPGVPLVAHGVPCGVERIATTGNAIVPQCAVVGPFRRIQELEGVT